MNDPVERRSLCASRGVHLNLQISTPPRAVTVQHDESMAGTTRLKRTRTHTRIQLSELKQFDLTYVL